jgi:hypothetical protein
MKLHLFKVTAPSRDPLMVSQVEEAISQRLKSPFGVTYKVVDNCDIDCQYMGSEDGRKLRDDLKARCELAGVVAAQRYFIIRYLANRMGS